MAYDDNNIFAKILRGEIPCDKVYESKHVFAFRDIEPQAPIHILVIPKGKYVSQQDFGEKASKLEISSFYRTVSKIAKQEGLVEGGYRAIANTGDDGGQEVPHFHLHLVGGKSLKGPIVVS